MRVLGNYKRHGRYYPGTLFAVDGNQCTIKYDDGDNEKNASTRQVLFLPKQTAATALSVGTCVLVHHPSEDYYEVGNVKAKQQNDIEVESINGDGSIVAQRKNLTVGGVG